MIEKDFNAETQRCRGAEKTLILCASAPLRLCVKIFFIFLLLSPYLECVDPKSFADSFLKDLQPEEIQIDLRNPTYCDGTFKTEEGGVVRTPTLRVQAKHIIYTKKLDGEVPLFYLEAEGQLLVSYAGRLFAGDKISYNFITKTGVIERGRAAIPPWYGGGERILLYPGGNYEIQDGYLTTSPNPASSWKVLSTSITVSENRHLRASNVQFCFINIPLLWIPSYNIDLLTNWKMPVQYYARWTGKLGPRLGARYLFYKSEEWEARLLLDYSFRRGAGAGVEAKYAPPCSTRRFMMRNYIGKDKIVELPNLNQRYRTTGSYEERLPYCFSFQASYDKMSDKFMASDYDQLEHNTNPINTTRASLSQQTEDWIASLQTLIRLNRFQSMKQELPNAVFSLRPLTLFESGILSETRVEAGYLDTRYEDALQASPFSSSRTELSQRFYRPFRLHPAFVLMPEAGFVWLHFGNNSLGHSINQRVGVFALHLNSFAYKYYGCSKHLLEPYVTIRSTHASAMPVVDYFLFDQRDSWLSLETARLGLRSSLFCKGICDEECDAPTKRLEAHFYTDFFWKQRQENALFPLATGSLSWLATDSTRYTLASSWDLEKWSLRYINLRSDYTVNKNIALAAEYRHRSDLAWRKANQNNFFLESLHSPSSLRASELSDQRDTLLTHLFWRMTPTFATKLQTLCGWNRRTQRAYFECQTDFTLHLQDNWISTLSFQKRTNDFRVTFHLSLDMKPPFEQPCPLPACIEGIIRLWTI